MADGMGAFAQGAHLRNLTAAIDNLVKVVNGQGSFLQGALKSSLTSLAQSIEHSSTRLVESLDNAAAAAREAGAASDRHARSLVLATWALFAATFVLVVVTAVHG